MGCKQLITEIDNQPIGAGRGLSHGREAVVPSLRRAEARLRTAAHLAEGVSHLPHLRSLVLFVGDVCILTLCPHLTDGDGRAPFTQLFALRGARTCSLYFVGA